MTRSPGTRWLLSILWLACLAYSVFRYGIDVESLVGLAALALVGAAVWFIATRTVRPLRSYLAVALGSACLAAVLRLTENALLALIFWATLTAGGLFWAWYWERTEPLPPTT